MEMPPGLTSMALAKMTVGAAFLLLHRRAHSDPSLPWWSAAFLLEGLRYFVEYGLPAFDGRIALEGLVFLVGNVSVLMAALRLDRVRVSPGWILFIVAMFGLVLFNAWLRPEGGAAVGEKVVMPILVASSVFLAAVRVRAGMALLRQTDGRLFARFGAAALFGMAAMAFVHLWGVARPGFNPWSAALVGALSMLAAFSILLMFHDRVRAQVERQSQRLAAIFDGTVQGIFSLDLDGRIATANPAFLRLMGVDSVQALPELAAMVPDPDERSSILQPSPEEPGRSITLRAADGHSKTVRVTASRREGSDEIDAFVLDVTELASMERELERSRRLEALGQLASGVAHDFNNVLSVIQASAELARDRGSGAEADNDFRAIVDATVRGSRLTRQLLTFGRSEPVTPEVVRVDVLLAEMGSWMPRVLGDSVRLEIDLPTDRGFEVQTDRVHVEQVLLNLLTNGRDAMPDGGTLRVSLSEAEDGRLKLRVEDEGTGIAPEIRAHLFDPFVTSKGERGTGLGLATVHSVVTRWGWDIEVEDVQPHGTRFVITLPGHPVDKAVESPSSDSHPSEGPDPAENGNGALRIVFVDDNAQLSRLYGRILMKAGHSVFTFAEGQSALEHLREHGADLLLTDIDMPGMSGSELVERALKMRPGLRIVMTSGHSQPEALRDRIRFLPKPFRGKDLLAAVDPRHAQEPGA